jgi:hypothetical protein
MTVQNALAIAEAGNSVAIIGRNAHRLVAEAAALAASNPAVSVIRRANGAESIGFKNGGQLTFHRVPQELRGRVLVAAYLTDIRDVRTGALDELDLCFGDAPHRIGALI